jgi:hypothetical protein
MSKYPFKEGEQVKLTPRGVRAQCSYHPRKMRVDWAARRGVVQGLGRNSTVLVAWEGRRTVEPIAAMILERA